MARRITTHDADTPADTYPLLRTHHRESSHARRQTIEACLNDRQLKLGPLNPTELDLVRKELGMLSNPDFCDVCEYLEKRLATLVLTSELIDILDDHSSQPGTNHVQSSISLPVGWNSSNIPKHRESLAQSHNLAEQRCRQITDLLAKEHSRRFPGQPYPLILKEAMLDEARTTREFRTALKMLTAEEVGPMLDFELWARNEVWKQCPSQDELGKKCKEHPTLGPILDAQGRRVRALQSSLLTKRDPNHDSALN